MKIFANLTCSGILISLILLLADAEIWNSEPRRLTVGDTYKYRYDAQILTGSPTATWQYTGFRLRCNIYLKVNEHNRIVMKMDDIEMRQFLDEKLVDMPRFFLSWDTFKQFNTGEIEEEMVVQLKKEITFSWVVGRVFDLQVAKDDPYWSLNIKKGVLNVINVNLMTFRHVDGLDGTSVGDAFDGAFDEEIDGECRSYYRWNPLSMNVEKERKFENVAISMTKTRALKDCKRRVEFHHSLILATACNQRRSNVTRDVVDSETTTTVNATRSRNNEFFIWDGETNSRYIFTPLDARMGSLQTFVKQTVNFVSNVKSPELKTPTNMVTTELLMENPVSEVAKEKALLEHEMNLLNEKRTSIRTLLKMTRNGQLKKDEERKLASDVRNFVQLCRRASEQQLLEIHDKANNERVEFPEIINFFHDILPSLATNEAVDIIIKRGIYGKIKDSEDAYDIKVAQRIRNLGTISNVYHASMIEKLVQVAQDDTLLRDRNRKETVKALWMTIGSLTKTYLEQTLWSVQKTVHVDIDNKLANNVMLLFKKIYDNDFNAIMTKEEKLIVLFKAIGNSGIREAMTILDESLMRLEEPMSVNVKVHTIYAMRNHALRFREAVQRMLMPLFFNTNVDTEIRLASFLMLMRTMPTREQLDTIRFAVERDPSKQVQRFVLSQWKTIANSNDDCTAEIRANVTQIMETMKDTFDDGIQYSHLFTVPLTKSHSAFIKSGLFFTENEMFPRAVNTKFYAEASGKRVEFLELGARMQGMQNVLKKIFDNFGDLKSFEEIIRGYDSDAILTDSNFSFYAKVFGDEFMYYAMDQKMKDILAQGYIAVRNDMLNIVRGEKPLEVNAHHTHYIDSLIRIPTTFGIPFTANFTSFVHGHLMGKLQINGNLFKQNNIIIDNKLTPRLVTEHTLIAGVELLKVKSFMEIRTMASVLNMKPVQFQIVLQKQTKENPTCAVRFVFEKLNFFNDNLVTLRNDIELVVETTNLRGEVTRQSKEFVPIYEIESNKELQSIIIDHKQCGTNLQIRYIIPRRHFVKVPLSFIFMGNFMLEVDIRNKEEQMLEMRTVYNRRRLQNEEARLLAFQILKTKTFNREPIEFKPFNQRTVNQKFQRNELKQESELLNTLLENTKTNEENKLFEVAHMLRSETACKESTCQMINKITFLDDSMTEKTFVGRWTMTLPNGVMFTTEEPLKVFSNKENRQTILLELFDEQEKMEKIVEFRAIIDASEESIRYKTILAKDLQRFEMLHSQKKQCVEDLNSGHKTSIACFNVWRYLNTMNRINSTITLFEKAPSVLKNFVAFAMNVNKNLCGSRVEMFDIATCRVNRDEWTINRVFEVSPFERDVAHITFHVNDFIVSLQQMTLPQVAMAYLAPGRSIGERLMRAMTRNHYPATCTIVKMNKDWMKTVGQIETFDGLVYNVEDETVREGEVIKRILVEDENRQVQVSTITTRNTRMLQVISDGKRKMPVVHVVQNIKDLGSNFVYVDGKKMFTINGNVVEKVNSNVNLFDMDVVIIGNALFQVRIPRLALVFVSDGQTYVKMRMSPLYHSNVRGFCGDFDGETSEEFKSMDCTKFLVNYGAITRFNTSFNLKLQNMATEMKDILMNAELHKFSESMRTCNRTEFLKPRLTPVLLENPTNAHRVEF
jgi:hypothetical protein